MDGGQPHVIRREVIEVATLGAADPFAVQRRIGALCGEPLGAAIEAALDRANPGGDHWTIERLDVDAGRISLDAAETGFVAAVASALEKGLRARASAPRGRASSRPDAPGVRRDGGEAGQGALLRRSPDEAARDAFLHFLATGVLPWWFRLPPGEDIEAAVGRACPGAAARADLARAIAANPRRDAMAIRLARQLSPGFLRALVGSVAGAGAAAVETVDAVAAGLRGAGGMRASLETTLWEAALLAMVHGRPLTPEEILPVWRARVDGAGSPERSRAARAASARWPAVAAAAGPASGADPAPAPEAAPAGLSELEAGLDVACAGLTLLHPFLPQLFAATGIAAGDAILAPDRALAMLHFLPTGRTSAPEHTLVLSKLLCGLPPEAPAPPPVTLTADETQEGLALLRAVIGHWGALGETSPDGLRGAYLARPGIYFRRGGGEDVLRVETHAFDVLLDRLPWGIGVVKLPWMTRMLRVEWGS